MRNCIKKVKDFAYFLVSERYPATEYVAGLIDSIKDTITIMNRCPWAFKLFEVIKLFFHCYAKTAICITITGALWPLVGKRIAVELFDAFNMPNWMLPICLFLAFNKLSKLIDIFELGT